MKNVNAKFKNLIRRLNYSQVRLEEIDSEKFKAWSYHNIPYVVNQLQDLGWNLDKDETWDELVFINNIVSWYSTTRVGLYVTSSYIDYKLAESIFNTKEFKNLRKTFKLDYHIVILVDPIMFLQEEDLDIIYNSLPKNKAYDSMDLSHYTEKDQLQPDYVSEWGWLEAEYTDSDMVLWTNSNISKFINNINYE